MTAHYSARPTQPWPSFIPDDLPDEVLMLVAMVDVAVTGEEVPPGMHGAGLQVTLNCDLELAVHGLRSLLAAMERDLAREQAAQRN